MRRERKAQRERNVGRRRVRKKTWRLGDEACCGEGTLLDTDSKQVHVGWVMGKKAERTFIFL